MCIFTGSVRSVQGTKIFVADIDDGQHCCVYSMEAAIDKPVAMVLPVPGANQKEIEFVNLEDYPKFFDDLEDCWVKPVSRGAGCAGGGSFLKVHDVGQYIASFVPSLAYFAKLSPEFRLSMNAAKSLSAYRGWGYAVFQLKNSANESNFHPMAFKYTPADRTTLFFPTVHIHDGSTYHEYERFDHILYAQPDKAADKNYWNKADRAPADFLVKKSLGLVHPSRSLFKIRIYGKELNHDYVLTSEYRLDPNPQTRSPK